MNQQKIYLAPDQLNLVKNILHKHLAPHTQVWAFGSRAKGDAKTYSDLDLALNQAGKPISISVLAALSFDFEESDLPYKVDIIDWNTIDTSFQEHIKNDLVEILM